MIIHQPETRRQNGEVVVSSRIEHHQDVEFPSELWFSVPEEYESQIAARADLFASTLIRVARALEEDMEVRGDLSPQLVFGLREYLKVHAAWSGNPNTININANNLVASKRAHPGGVASCNISGGIDSFYTLWSQRPENEPVPELQVKYGIYGHGLSFPARNDFLRQTYFPGLKKMIQALGVKLLAVNSNISLFRHPDPWLPIGGGRIALPLLFSPLISIHYIPGSQTYDKLMPWGVHPMTDHLHSMESLRIFTHGSEFSRFEKLREMVDWKPMYDYLQVCNNIKAEKLNDCKCRKCLQTMMMIEVLGIGEKVTTFHLPMQRIRFAGRVIKWDDRYLEFKMMANHSRASGKKSLIPILYIQMLIYKLTSWMKPLLGHKFK